MNIRYITVTFSAPYIAANGELYVNIEYGTAPDIVCRVIGVIKDGFMYEVINDVI
jgi:hypothetical protein